jgi:RND family efflux transporter MFP subunit
LAVAAVLGIPLYVYRFSPVVVQTTHVAPGTIVAEVLGTGTLEARVGMTISSKIAGRIQTVRVDQGTQVAAGDLLVELDADELAQQAAIAQANVQAAQAGLLRLQADKRRAEAVHTQAEANFDRIRSLVQQAAISRDEEDKATELLSVASAEIARAEAAWAEGQKVLLSAEKTLQYHQARLNDARIVAPFPGMITKRHREAGDVAVPGGSILSLISTDELWISAWVDETEMARLRVGQPARVVFRSQPNCPYTGQVVRLAQEVDRETREFLVDVRLSELPQNWAVGQRAEVYLEVEAREASAAIPADYLVRTPQGAQVWVLDQGVLQLRPVELGIRGPQGVEVVAGLQAGQSVVDPVSLPSSAFSGRSARSK